MPVIAIQNLKQKYPQYANIDDAVLAEKLGAKYPQYAHLSEEVAKDRASAQLGGADVSIGSKPQKGIGDFFPNTVEAIKDVPNRLTKPTLMGPMGKVVMAAAGEVGSIPGNLINAGVDAARANIPYMTALEARRKGTHGVFTGDDKLQGADRFMRGATELGIDVAAGFGADKLLNAGRVAQASGEVGEAASEGVATALRKKSPISGSNLTSKQVLDAAEQGIEVPSGALNKLDKEEIGRYTKLQKESLANKVAAKKTKLDEDVKLLDKHLESKSKDAAERIKNLAEGESGVIKRKSQEFERGIEEGFKQGESTNFKMTRAELEDKVAPKFKLLSEEGENVPERVSNTLDRIFKDSDTIDAKQLYHATRDLPGGDIVRNGMLDIADEKGVTAFRETNKRYSDWLPTKRILERDFRANQPGPVDFGKAIKRLRKSAYAPDKEVYIKEIESLIGEPLSKDLVDIVQKSEATKLEKASLSIKSEMERLNKQAFTLGEKERHRLVPRRIGRLAAKKAVSGALWGLGGSAAYALWKKATGGGR